MGSTLQPANGAAAFVEPVCDALDDIVGVAAEAGVVQRPALESQHLLQAFGRVVEAVKLPMLIRGEPLRRQWC